MRNVFEKDVINLDERVNICFMVMNGDMFTLFPGPFKENKWLAALDAAPETVNQSPYDNGWMIKLKVTATAEVDALLSAGDYEKSIT